MGIYAEALILYAVLFLPGSIIGLTGSVDLPASADFIRVFMFYIPSTALIWHLLFRGKQARDWGIKPGKKDLFSGLIAFPCLLIIGFIIVYASSFFGAADGRFKLHTPSTAREWAIICFSCICTGYLEESFFRFYLLSRFNGGGILLSKREKLKLSAPAVTAVSAALFSICHIYEGPWGMANAALSGVLLSLVFLRYRSLHGIALAHGLYNIAAYAAAAITSS